MCHVQEPAENDLIFDLRTRPYQIQRILVGLKPARQRRRIVPALPLAPRIADAQPKVPRAHLECGIVNERGERLGDIAVYLDGINGRREVLVGEGCEIDAWDHAGR